MLLQKRYDIHKSTKSLNLLLTIIYMETWCHFIEHIARVRNCCYRYRTCKHRPKTNTRNQEKIKKSQGCITNNILPIVDEYMDEHAIKHHACYVKRWCAIGYSSYAKYMPCGLNKKYSSSSNTECPKKIRH